MQKDNLSTRQLQKIVRKEKSQLPSNVKAELKIHRGKPGVYRLKHIDGTLNIDCGFYDYIKKPEISNIKNENKYIVYDDSDKHKFIKPDKSLLYTFKAKIIEAADGDTVKALLYRVFGIKTLRTLRLRRINAKDLQTEQGRKAREYIISKLFMLPL